MKNQFVLKPSGLIEGQRSPTVLIEGPRNGGEETVFTPLLSPLQKEGNLSLSRNRNDALRSHPWCGARRHGI